MSCPSRSGSILGAVAREGWQRQAESNRRIRESKALALPLGYVSVCAAGTWLKPAAAVFPAVKEKNRLGKSLIAMEGGVGFEPTSCRCAAAVLPEAPPTHIPATGGGG